ncbi:MAG: tRNA-guanine transglycosylase, partial [Bacteroidales bacterium]|nr:tRNA-guanine transglycosylase [Bacteroidales bacterium]
MKFEVLSRDSTTSARRGRIYTDHGTVETPIFMPVGTVGSVKGVYHKDLREDIHAQIILGN